LAELAPNTGYEINPARAQRPELQFLYEYWQSKRAGRVMPPRAELKIRELKAHLGWISLIDVLPDDFRYRLIGTRITAYFRTDTTGQTVTETFARVPKAGAMMLALLKAVASQGIAIRTYGNLSWMGNDLEDFESLFLPFSDDGKTVNMIMNPFVFDQARVYLNRQLTARP
jgi:hypothetical protein